MATPSTPHCLGQPAQVVHADKEHIAPSQGCKLQPSVILPSTMASSPGSKHPASYLLACFLNLWPPPHVRSHAVHSSQITVQFGILITWIVVSLQCLISSKLVSQARPPAVAGCKTYLDRVLEGLASPWVVPSGQSDHWLHWVNAQSVGGLHGPMLHGACSEIAPLQAAPPSPARDLIRRSLENLPASQVVLQLFQSLQSVKVQFTPVVSGPGSAHGCVSLILPSQGRPPSSGGLNSRDR